MHLCVCARARACMSASGRAGERASGRAGERASGRLFVCLEPPAICRCRGPRTIKKCFAILSCATAVFLVCVCVCLRGLVHPHACTHSRVDARRHPWQPSPQRARAQANTYSFALSRSPTLSLCISFIGVVEGRLCVLCICRMRVSCEL
jgi:hypothetical protein